MFDACPLYPQKQTLDSALRCPFCARTGREQSQQKVHYSITSSAEMRRERAQPLD
jgi:hypothetical protein